MSPISAASMRCCCAATPAAPSAMAAVLKTNLEKAVLTGCHVYGISAWNVKLSEDTKQQELVITTPYEPEVTVNNLEVAQFIYLLLHNEKLQRVIDTVTSKVVLILSCFSPQRKEVLDALRDELRKRDYVPVLFRLREARGSNNDQHRDAACTYGAVRDRGHLRRQKRTAGVGGDCAT